MSKNFCISLDLPAPPAQVYQAITLESSLKLWLTSHAKISLPEGVYELWGPYLPGAPVAPSTRLLHTTANESVRFAWCVRGRELQVQMELAPAETGTHFTLTQDSLTHPPGEASLADFWMLSLENLRRLVNRGSAPVFCDFSVRPLGQATIAAEILSSPEEVFHALIDPAQLERYIATKVTLEPHVGGKYDFGWGNGPLKILDLQPARRLSYSWQHGEEPETVVTWTLEGSGGRTRLTLVHSGFAPERLSDDYRTGWLQFVNALKSMLETGADWRASKVENS